MPPINHSSKAEAKELFYSSLMVPLNQKGYYVVPPILTKEILKEENAYNAEMLINNNAKELGDLFGVDAVLFTTIHQWAKTTIASQIRVVVEYTLISTKTDQVIFSRTGDVTYRPDADTGNILRNIVTNILTTALTREIAVGRRCNIYTLGDIPEGRYSPLHGTDGKTPAGSKLSQVRIQ